MNHLLWIVPGLPALAGLLGLLIPLRSRRIAAAVALIGMGGALIAALGFAVSGVEATSTFRLADFGDVSVSAAGFINPIAAYVAVAVIGVAFLVQLYSIAYLREDSRYSPYAAQISLFTAAMSLVVVADDLILLLIGWEVMGACSYLLIGHDRKLPAAPKAAVKAFLVTRVGDVGLLLGILLLGIHLDTFSIPRVLEALPQLDETVLLAAALLILAGAVGKSAQFPLHTWLPDAMAGPTPVSALIHAATMVAAGAYLLYRLLPLYTGATVAMVIAIVAAVTMVFAALAALTSDDLKRVLAWSTVSQVAFMFGGIAVAAGEAAMFHLLSHAAFKALLFLVAGAVIHMVASNSMSAMGGLRTGAPVTFWTMTIGFGALAGIPPLSGFWSKESILGAAAATDSPVGNLVLWAGILTVALTAGYAMRAWLLTFFGARRSEGRAHDPAPLMWIPLIVLAVPAALLGIAVFAGPEAGPLAGPTLHLWPAVPVLVATAVGALGMWLWWRTDTAADPVARLGGLAGFAAGGFGTDAAQRFLVTRPLRGLALATLRADRDVVDGAAEGTGRSTTRLAVGMTRLHTAGVPRHLLATLGGAVVIALVGLAAYWGGPT
ncbi:NADH dehydrogenase subunit L [Stackebrandtia endophytica]|uniref:NADH dehydrogenase subunit L n=1 Tax=Stackebrandtia endophytica TaxID=1496996 RepID=A0A543AUU8_9ACTN|nr:NADH-quinone oxidoreductase subunit L [Stackebrandtia endophytica]TQL76363.1 NADH dehydrogenase subunit L [Stackebrandtia endophytica]